MGISQGKGGTPPGKRMSKEHLGDKETRTTKAYSTVPKNALPGSLAGQENFMVKRNTQRRRPGADQSKEGLKVIGQQEDFPEKSSRGPGKRGKKAETCEQEADRKILLS